MLREEAIARDVLFPYLEQDLAFEKVPPGFWQYFLEGLVQYEKDQKPLFAALYRLKLKDPELIIQRLPRIYNNFLEDLAELYVLGKAEGIVQKSGLLKNSKFREHLLFFKDLKNAVAKLERDRMIKELPAAYSALSEEISEETISKLVTKHSREQLKKKFKKWEEEETIMYEANEISITTSYNMEFPRKSFELKEEQHSARPPVEKAKPPSSLKIWIPVIIAIILIAIVIWLLS